ncbi:MAG: glycosyltransferase family 4 protein [Burkholderiaceae bacterium]|nr:glycosyltransferase family 4 protein [Burkholderiaceae bacterium]
MPPVLIVATLLTGQSPTGVETHFNQLIAQARAAGIDARLVSAQHNKDLRRKVASLAHRVLKRITPELARCFVREADARHLERKLQRAVASLTGRRIVVDAQDPLSARSALRVRARRPMRIVMTAHFNVSEADEMLVKGLTSKGGLLWRHTMQIEKSTLSCLDHLIFVSEFMQARVLERRPELRERSRSVINNFCAQPEPESESTLADRDLIAIGTLEPRKNQGFLLDVLAACRQRGHRYTLTIAGDGPDRQTLAKRASELDLDEQVTFLGNSPNAARLLYRHRVLVHAARMENMPLILAEALAAGRPALVGAVGGIPEVVRHDVEGLHWPLDAPERAAAQLIELLESPGVWSRMSRAARHRYENGFAPAVLAPKWLNTILAGTSEICTETKT